MRLLILTQYFPPEVGAPQNRLYELAVRLQQKGMEVSVLTAMPNYPQMKVYEGYQGKRYHKEMMNGITVHRSWIYTTTSKGIFKRLLNYFSFVASSFFTGWFRLGKFDYILCESPPLFLGKTAFLLKKIKRAKLIFNVSDLWPESAERLGLVTNTTFLKMATWLEEFLYNHADLISGQTQGIVKNISQRFPSKKIYWLPNGVDLNYYKADAAQLDWRSQQQFKSTDFILLYAGIIGHAQGLEVILHAAQQLKEKEDIKFVLLGSGPEKDKLIELKKQLQLTNVYFFDAVSKNEMPAIIAASNAAVVPLKRLDLFKGAIPSKIFENLAMKKPLLLGVEGEAKDLFITQGNAGLAFTPEDATDLAGKALQLYNNKDQAKQLGENGFHFVQEKFTRDKIANEFYNWITINHSS
ncbi:MAG TPA: glycosyltransferase family 4 protein [Bacteroidia bacterium]|jgi:glycosyltransferase involved in cell wall biosynthesis|nr:glycosyltransferase family 4 protein [Bacteroidia bacterium]